MCCEPIPLEANSHCRKKRKRRIPQVEGKSAGCSNKVQDFTLEPQPSSPAPDLLKAPGLTPQPSSSAPVNVSPTLKLSNASADLPEFQATLPLSPAGVRDHADPQNETEPLLILGYSVNEYQGIYHSIVDERLRYKSGRPRPYSLQLGRKIKQCLWEKLNQPQITVQERSDGLLKVNQSKGEGNYPPLIHVDISGEPNPRGPRRKKAKLT